MLKQSILSSRRLLSSGTFNYFRTSLNNNNFLSVIANHKGLDHQFSSCLFAKQSLNSNQSSSNNSNNTTTSESSKTEEELRQEIAEEERKIKELEKQLYSEKQAMSMIFKASGSSFGFKRRSDDGDANNPNIPQLSPEESLKARVLGYKLASLALVYGTLLNVAAAIIFILICYFVFDIKTVLDLKNVIRRIIRGKDYQHADENLTPEQRVEKMTQLFKSTIVKQNEIKDSEKEDKSENQN
ncbi:predicted protein [Naegleria gruberi]|uniref:Predicted protein n=1 Tax=Naegleria gruberi TaxID=5762 RepID=D2V476_NAEGR|nr:uncharacterized protein NAEGRDRAFT_46560 [Naegleria gruberi]EFC48333.1 predicted protein [Naegleria gruberi]|eukprot:XP_002681077.1 predicted protein [Naegleria gruberi strain NEG-M]